jgi:broad specificity phosphatase PhoE
MKPKPTQAHTSTHARTPNLCERATRRTHDILFFQMYCRHGHSRANADGIIVSSLDQGKEKLWGLSDLGKSQAEEAGRTLLASLQPNLVIIASPFSRTVETAEWMQRGASIVNATDPLTDEDLRERYFGSYDGDSTDSYALVWNEDVKDANAEPPGGGESVFQVAQRVMRFVKSIETHYSDHNIVVVSHGDALSILAAVMLGSDLRQHRQHGLPNCGWLRIDPTTKVP